MSNVPCLATLYRPAILSLTLAALAGVSTPAFAAGTAVDTSVSTQASFSFRQGDAATQSFTETRQFSVGRLVDMTVSPSVGRDVDAGQTIIDLDFTITNTGNGTDSFALKASTNVPAEHIVSVQTFRKIEGRGGDILEPVSRAELSADESAEIVVRVTVSEAFSQLQGASIAACLEATSQYAESGGSDTADKTSEPVVFGDGAGDTDAEGDGRHSATGEASFTSASVTMSSDVFVHSGTSAYCGDFGMRANPTEFVPGVCIEYRYDFANAEGGATATDVAFETVLDPHLKYVAVDMSGPSSGSVSLPSANADCAVESCRIAIEGAELPGGTQGYVRIHAVLK